MNVNEARATIAAGLLAVMAFGHLALSAQTQTPLPAFPGAEGYGAGSVGGRGGRVIPVVNLNDGGPGSLRSALAAEGPRTIVFRVGGVIELEGRLRIASPYVTVAGQTAPGDGITLKATERNSQMLWIQNHDVVIRHIAIRGGNYGKPGYGQVNIMLDPIPAQGDRYGDIYNVVLDHLSVSWSLDENIAVFRNLPDNPDTWPNYPVIRDITVQHCLIAEGLYPHSTGLQAGGERIPENALSPRGGPPPVQRLSIHRNLFASNSHRNPAIGGQAARMINNVVYNWSSKAAETHASTSSDWIANYFKPGPLSALDHVIVHNDFLKGQPQNRHPPPSIHTSSNRVAGQDQMTEDDLYRIHYEEHRGLPSHYRRDQPLTPASIPVEIAGATQAYLSVVNDVGSRIRIGDWGGHIGRNDPVDLRILSDVRLSHGPGYKDGLSTHYTDPAQTGGMPSLLGGAPYPDKDGDGMADAWEVNVGLDPESPNSPQLDRDGDGYTDLEEFLNGTSPFVSGRGRTGPAPRRQRRPGG